MEVRDGREVGRVVVDVGDSDDDVRCGRQTRPAPVCGYHLRCMSGKVYHFWFA